MSTVKLFVHKTFNVELLMSNFSVEILFLNIFSIYFDTVLSQSMIILREVFRDYQVNIENTTNLNSSF